ncbi:hypothetical protein POM88_038534 [Heracleum sosnowskyi]|uniref:Centromere protein C n=1 Tax=Heracleum sosnowskyi TaxID=360622 RepID=A0AAD8M8F0_9APIA|nr:hypothetical protein POM88_038534 [Heracleum sosnowskyi]
MAPIEARSSDDSDPTHSRQFQEPRSQDNVFRKANGISHGDSGALNSTYLSLPALENDNKADASISIRNPRGKRPALGYKPSQFSLRPNMMQASAGLEFNMDIDQLHDPVDFFSAYGKLQYAKDEIQRHTCGSITKTNDYMPSANPCSLRPEILGKSVSYMHHYESVVSENDDTFSSFQEAIQDDSLCPSKFVSQQETAHSDIDLQGKELAESISKTENRINELLDKLLSESIGNLDADGSPSQLQQGLQRKSVNVVKYLPDCSDTGRTGILDLGKEFSKNRKAQTDISEVMRGLSVKTPVKMKHVAEKPVHTLASPTTPKSPFAALSLLNKHISRSKPIIDPFRALDIDPSLAKNTSSLKEFNRQSQQLDERKELTVSDRLTFPTEVEATRTAVTGTVSKNSIEGVTPNLLDKSVNVNPSRVSVNIRSRGSNDVMVHHNEDNNVTDSARANAATNLCTTGANRMSENVQNMHQDTTDCSTTKNDDFSYSPSGQSDSNFTKALLMNGQLIVADSTFRKDLKQRNKALKKGSAKDLSKARTHEQERRKATTRQSLIETGTCWESGVRRSKRIRTRPLEYWKGERFLYGQSGVRRSKRIRTRPLEYWKGERFLYGRVHESLATVIGIKCMSPAVESGEPTFRVSSYVSDEHKELVELAARH